jgi:hypothetical protein
MLQVPGTEVRIPCFGVFLFAGERGGKTVEMQVLIISVLKTAKTPLFGISESKVLGF